MVLTLSIQRLSAQSLGPLPSPSSIDQLYPDKRSVDLMLSDTSLIFCNTVFDREAIPGIDYYHSVCYQTNKNGLDPGQIVLLEEIEPRVPNRGVASNFGPYYRSISSEYYNNIGEAVKYLRLFDRQGNVLLTLEGQEAFCTTSPIGANGNITYIMDGDYLYLLSIPNGDTLHTIDLKVMQMPEGDTLNLIPDYIAIKPFGDSLFVEYRMVEDTSFRYFTHYYTTDTLFESPRLQSNVFRDFYRQLDVDGAMIQISYQYLDDNPNNLDTLRIEKRNLQNEVLIQRQILHSPIPKAEYYLQYQLGVHYAHGHFLLVQHYFYWAEPSQSVGGLYIWLLNDQLVPVYELNVIDSTARERFTRPDERNIELDEDLYAYIVTADNYNPSSIKYELLIVDPKGNIDSREGHTRYFNYHSGIYPNPTKDILYLDLREPPLQFLLFDAQGNQLSTPPLGINYSMKVGSLAAGLYTIAIQMPNGTWQQKKFLKE